MTELKAGVIVTPHDEGMCFNRDSDVIAVTERETEFYIKSDVDKVLAEKNKDIQRLENLCESYRIDCDKLAIREANACKEIERDNKQIRHQKYKRCLAMVQLCKDNADWWDYEQINRLDEQRGNAESLRFKEAHAKFCHYVKWEKYWMEIAEEPTWTKFLQLIHKEAK